DGERSIIVQYKRSNFTDRYRGSTERIWHDHKSTSGVPVSTCYVVSTTGRNLGRVDRHIGLDRPGDDMRVISRSRKNKQGSRKNYLCKNSLPNHFIHRFLLPFCHSFSPLAVSTSKSSFRACRFWKSHHP